MPEVGMFELEVTAFEDSGVHWTLPLEDFRSFQFAKDSAVSDDQTVAVLEGAIARFDEALIIQSGHDALAETDRRLSVEVEASTEWLAVHSEFVRSVEELDTDTATGPPLLRSELGDYLESRGLADIERSVAEAWVSNPRSGEIVKAHQVVMARLGLAPYQGQILRDPRSLTGEWNQQRREEHILARVGFIRSVFARLDLTAVVLYRGLTFEHQPTERQQPTLISTTFRREVAEAWLDSDPTRFAANLLRQSVPISRLFMTYLETEAMNGKYQEAEAVIFSEPQGILF